MEYFPHMLEWAVLVAFMCCTGTLFAMAVVKRLRIGKPVSQFKTGLFLGFPPLQTLFVVFVTILFVQSISSGLSASNLILGLYAVCGGLWLAGTVLSQSVYITRSGIISDLWSNSGFLPWWRVSDYFSVTRGNSANFVFFVEHSLGQLRRVEYTVPSTRGAEFTKAVDQMTGYRFSGEDFSGLPKEWQDSTSHPKSTS